MNIINNNNHDFDIFEFNNQDNFNNNNNEFSKKRRSDASQKMNNCLINYNDINEKINNQQNYFYQNARQDFREPE